MEILYQRSADASYMILPQEYEVRPYEEQMLANNRIPYLLTFFGRRMNDSRQLWYDITSQKSFRSFCANGSVNRDELMSIFQKLIEAFKGLKEYLISDSSILLTEDTLYLSGRGMDVKVSLCFYPGAGNNLQQQLMGIYEFLMPVIDQRDEVLAKFIYEGYELLCDEAFSLDEWQRSIPEINPTKPADEPVHGLSGMPQPAPMTELNNDSFNEDELKIEQRRAILNELYEDDEEEDEGIIDRFTNFFGGLKAGINLKAHRKKDEYFPPKDLQADHIYDPLADIPSPPTKPCIFE